MALTSSIVSHVSQTRDWIDTHFLIGDDLVGELRNSNERSRFLIGDDFVGELRNNNERSRFLVGDDLVHELRSNNERSLLLLAKSRDDWGDTHFLIGVCSSNKLSLSSSLLLLATSREDRIGVKLTSQWSRWAWAVVARTFCDACHFVMAIPVVWPFCVGG